MPPIIKGTEYAKKWCLRQALPAKRENLSQTPLSASYCKASAFIRQVKVKGNHDFYGLHSHCPENVRFCGAVQQIRPAKRIPSLTHWQGTAVPCCQFLVIVPFAEQRLKME